MIFNSTDIEIYANKFLISYNFSVCQLLTLIAGKRNKLN